MTKHFLAFFSNGSIFVSFLLWHRVVLHNLFMLLIQKEGRLLRNLTTSMIDPSHFVLPSPFKSDNFQKTLVSQWWTLIVEDLLLFRSYFFALLHYSHYKLCCIVRFYEFLIRLACLIGTPRLFRYYSY